MFTYPVNNGNLVFSKKRFANITIIMIDLMTKLTCFKMNLPKHFSKAVYFSNRNS